METQDGIRYYRCVKANGEYGYREGDVYPAWVDSRGDVEMALSGDSHEQFVDAEGLQKLRECFEQVTAEDFEASIHAAMRGIDDVRGEQAQLMKDLAGFNATLLGAGEVAPEQPTSGAIQAVNPAGQIRNRAHGYKRRASELAVLVKERKEFMDIKLGQKLAMAMASLDDMQKVVSQLEQVVYTVQLYLGRDEEVVCLRDGNPASAETPICIRQNVLYMDEECALEEEHGIDYSEIESFDRWLLAKPEHLAQVLPEPKGVVVLTVRRYAKKYTAETIAEAIANGEKHEKNAKSYWLIKNGERLHRIHADIQVGERLIPREDELECFFFHRNQASGDVEAIRPGSRDYIEAMESASVVRRHYMQLALVLQGLLDRTQLFAPYAGGSRPNLLDPDGNVGIVHFLRDVEKTITDGRPDFYTWQAKINSALQHGHRIVGWMATHFRKEEENRITPKHADGVNADPVHTVLEDGDKLYFRFKRTDTVYRGYEAHDPKRAGTYVIYRDDKSFLCLDSGVTVDEIKYYLTDRRQRKTYEHMIPCLKSALEVLEQESRDERPFRDLLLRKLEEAVPHNPCTPELLEKLIRWWKTKTKEHRALMADDSKAYRMIISRYTAQAENPMTEEDRAAMLEAVARIPEAIFAFHRGGHDFGVLCTLENSPYFLREETWRVTKGTAHQLSANVELVQKPEYEAYVGIYSTKAWSDRPAFFSPSKVLSPEHYSAVVDFVRSNLWFDKDEDSKRKDERLAAIYCVAKEHEIEIRVATIELNPDERGGWGLKRGTPTYQTLDEIPLPEGHERLIGWSGKGASTKFSFYRAIGNTTWIDFDGKIQLGWEHYKKYSQQVFVLFHDPSVTDEAKKKIGERLERKRYIDALGEWVGSACASAEAYLIDKWKQGHLAKYMSEGGDIEFFDDHLKTIPAYKPDVHFVRSFLERAINAGRTPTELCTQSIDEIEKLLSPIVEENDGFCSRKREVDVPAEERAVLVGGKWMPPAFIA